TTRTAHSSRDRRCDARVDHDRLPPHPSRIAARDPGRQALPYPRSRPRRVPRGANLWRRGRMARRLIGLDIGTNAVTIAEVTAGAPPRLDMFAQVALPRDAMREGEVADEAAVADAVARLRTEVGLKRVAVRVGIASPRVVVRQVEMPVMTRDELMSALKFQAADLIPTPIEDAVLAFAILGASAPTGDAEPTMQVLLV